MWSRRHPVKVMGAVGRPNKKDGFNGKIHMERVSRMKKPSKSSANHRFSDDAIVRHELKAGKSTGKDFTLRGRQ
jgi:hypothetical protein